MVGVGTQGATLAASLNEVFMAVFSSFWTAALMREEDAGGPVCQAL